MSGPAIIRDRRRRVSYVASMAQAGERSVTFCGRLQHRTVAGEHRYAEQTRTLPLGDVEIIWITDEPGVTAA
jgi:hypothetical protein